MDPADIIYDIVIEKYREGIRPVRVFIKIAPSNREIICAKDAITNEHVELNESDIDQVENAITMMKWAILNDEDQPPPEIVDYLRSV